MTLRERVDVARADVVGSLLRPPYLKEARRAVRAGTATLAELRAAEDRAVREAITLQEAAGLDVLTDGEYRRNSWVATMAVVRDDPSYQSPLAGLTTLPAEPGWLALWKESDGRRAERTVTERAFVTEPLRVVRDIVEDEYPFLKAHAHARTKYTIPSPSWHRIFWHPEYSHAAYPTAESFLRAVRDYLREEVVAKLIRLGCDYIQMDAPNYAQWYVDPEVRAAFEADGHNMAAELVADAEVDNEVFAGITGITRAIHICRGNLEHRWLATGGYEPIAEVVFPRLTNYDTLLLEYDTPRAGTFGPLRHSLPHHAVVLGLLTTKRGALEDAATVERRIREATAYVPLERLALSPQCGFASVEGATTMTPAEQDAKLRLIGQVAHRVWGG